MLYLFVMISSLSVTKAQIPLPNPLPRPHVVEHVYTCVSESGKNVLLSSFEPMFMDELAHVEVNLGGNVIKGNFGRRLNNRYFIFRNPENLCPGFATSYNYFALHLKGKNTDAVLYCVDSKRNTSVVDSLKCKSVR